MTIEFYITEFTADKTIHVVIFDFSLCSRPRINQDISVMQHFPQTQSNKRQRYLFFSNATLGATVSKLAFSPTQMPH